MRMKLIPGMLLLCIALVNTTSFAQSDISGIWQGEMDIGGQKLTVEFVLKNDSKGNWTAIVNTPHTGAIKNVKARTVEYDGENLKIGVPDLQGEYSGSLAGESFEGKWVQGGSSMALNLEHFNKPLITPADYERVAGVYTDQPWSQLRIEISTEDGHLYVQPPNQERQELKPLDGGVKFRMEGMPMDVTFMQNTDGNVDSYEVSRNGQPGPSVTRVEVLKEKYAAVSKQLRPNGLADAVLMGDLESARALIDAGIDIQELDTRPGIAGGNGRRPLNHAALRNNVEMIDLLLDAGAEINKPNNSGFTPLHHAAEAGSVDAARRLIERGADLTLITRGAATPRDIAEITNHPEVLKVLEDAEKANN